MRLKRFHAMTIQVTDKNNDDICFEPQDFLDHFETVTDLSKTQDEIDTSADSVDNYQASLVDNADNCQASLVDNADNSQAPHLSSPSNNDAPHVKPKFKVGDPVYCPMLRTGSIQILGEQPNKFNDFYPVGIGRQGFTSEGKAHGYASPQAIFHATEEIRQALQVLHPDITFERPPTQADIDNEAVDKLAQAMKDKLAKKREEGYGGWDKPHCTNGNLSDFLRIQVKKGDPVDVANFCAFLFSRGSEILQKPF